MALLTLSNKLAQLPTRPVAPALDPEMLRIALSLISEREKAKLNPTSIDKMEQPQETFPIDNIGISQETLPINKMKMRNEGFSINRLNQSEEGVSPISQEFRTPKEGFSPTPDWLKQQTAYSTSKEPTAKGGEMGYHTTNKEIADIINKEGFKSGIGNRSLGVTKGSGVWIYDNPEHAQEFGKNFENPVTIETKINGKIFDATNDDRGIREIAEDSKLIKKLKFEGYVGVKGNELGIPVNFIFEPRALSTPKLSPKEGGVENKISKLKTKIEK